MNIFNSLMQITRGVDGLVSVTNITNPALLMNIKITTKGNQGGETFLL